MASSNNSRGSDNENRQQSGGDSVVGTILKGIAFVGGALAIGYAVSKCVDELEESKQSHSSSSSKKGEHPPPQPGSECPICWTPYSPPLEVLPCKHLFHTQCITKWITEKWTCPICKEEIDKSFRKEYLQRARETRN